MAEFAALQDSLMYLLPVPIIAVFTKYDQFKRNVKMKLEDKGLLKEDVEQMAPAEAKERFKRDYLGVLRSNPRFVCLERMSCLPTSPNRCTDALVVEMHKGKTHCQDLINTTADMLSDDVLAVMLLAVQKGSLELSIKAAVKR